MTNQKVLGIILVLFIILGTGYFAFTRFKQEIISVTASPSPSPSGLEFLFNKTPAPLASGQSQPAATNLPLSKNKHLNSFPGILNPDVIKNKAVLIQTKKGNIALEIYPEATKAASNFMILASNGFYDGLTFHRVEDWVVQGGDPSGNGTGGPGYQFEDEPVTREYLRGILAMANAGPNTNGSQFFILKTDYPLPPNYTIFGNVISGIDVVDKLTIGDVMEKVTVQNLR